MIIKVNLPYPSIEEIVEDKRAAAIISGAYAGHHGELKAVLQYVYHYFNFRHLGDEQTAKILMGIAICEMEHLKILGEFMLKLGVDPIYTRFPPFRTEYFNAAYLSYSKSPVKMLLDDVAMEMTAISEYEKVEKDLKNEKHAAIIKRIALDEELHVKALKERLEKYKS